MFSLPHVVMFKQLNSSVIHGEQWWRSGGSALLSPVWPRLDSGPVSCMGWECCWLSPCSQGFSQGSPDSPPSKKASVSKFQLHQDKARARKPSKSDVVSSLNIAIFYLVIIYLRFKVPVFITLLTLLSTFSKVMYRMGSYETPALLQTPNVFTLSTSRATTVT